MNNTITLAIGQVVPWPPAPLGFAQISELRRRRVQICYPFKNGRIARPIVTPADIARLERMTPLLFRLDNPYNRGIVRREAKLYDLAPPKKKVRCTREAA